jgi:hypothetical protein
MQDKNGSDSAYLVPGTWYPAPLHHFHISNLNGALLPYSRRRIVSAPRRYR